MTVKPAVKKVFKIMKPVYILEAPNMGTCTDCFWQIASDNE